jgi:hypothetical protein
MSSFPIDARRGHLIDIGTKATMPAVLEGNSFIVSIRSIKARLGLLEDGGMVTMLANRADTELAEALSVAAVDGDFEVGQSPLIRVSELGCLVGRTK